MAVMSVIACGSEKLRPFFKRVGLAHKQALRNVHKSGGPQRGCDLVASAPIGWATGGQSFSIFSRLPARACTIRAHELQQEDDTTRLANERHMRAEKVTIANCGSACLLNLNRLAPVQGCRAGREMGILAAGASAT